MSVIRFVKEVSALPGTLTPDTLYAIRVGVGFDLYMSDNTGAVAHKVNGAVLGAAQTFTAAQGVAPAALTDGATINTDAALSNLFTVTLGGNRTLANPTNLVAGRTYIWAVTQDATGGRTLAYGSAFKWAGGAAPTLTTAADAVDLIVGLCVDGTNLLCSFTGDFA